MKEIKTMVLSAGSKEALETAFKEIAKNHVIRSYVDTTMKKSPYNIEPYKVYMRAIIYEKETRTHGRTTNNN